MTEIDFLAGVNHSKAVDKIIDSITKIIVILFFRPLARREIPT